MYSIVNARVILPDRIVSGGTVVVSGGKITEILEEKKPAQVGKIIKAGGNYLAPGFIDLHIHGDIKVISRRQARGGTCGFLATLHPAAPRQFLENISRAVSCPQEYLPGAKMLGIRLEGPFLNPDFCGALPRECLRRPDITEARRIIKSAGGMLKMVVLAVEMSAADKLIRLFKRHNIIVSIGHTGAAYEQTKKAIAAGVNHATHTFNRMGEFSHRAPGAIGAVLTDERVCCEVIADGIHAHPGALRLLLLCKGIDRMMLITDSTAAQSEPDKQRRGDVFKLKDGTLYGTDLTLIKALQNTVDFLGVTMSEAVRMVTLNPARLLRIDGSKGSIARGKDADLVMFDEKFKVRMTMVEGKIVYRVREDICAG